MPTNPLSPSTLSQHIPSDNRLLSTRYTSSRPVRVAPSSTPLAFISHSADPRTALSAQPHPLRAAQANRQVPKTGSVARPPLSRLATPITMQLKPDDNDESKPPQQNSFKNSNPNPVEQFFDNAKANLKKLHDCCEALKEKGAKSLDELWQPMNLLNHMAEDRANIDHRNNPVIKTCLTVAGMKKAAGVLPHDDITPRLVGKDLMNGMSLLVNLMPNLFRELGVVSRTPWLDNRIEQIVSQEGIEQMVVLAAGLDTRAYHMPVLKDVDVYELDLPEMIQAKNSLFENLAQEDQAPLNPISKSLTRIEGDLLNSNWSEALKSAGFDSDKPTLFLLEGLIYYFDPEQAAELGSQISAASGDGSHLLFDCMNQACIEPSGFDKLIGKPTMFESSIDQPEQWGKDVGFDEVTVLQPGEEGANFGLFNEKEADSKGFHRAYLGTFDRFTHLLPRDQEAPDGKPVRRFFFVECQKGQAPSNTQ